MPTQFFELAAADLPTHRAHFTACHQQNMPGNELAVMTNVAGDRVLAKVNCDDTNEAICGGCPVLAIYDFEQARALLQTPEWQHDPVM